jgi:Tat protein secretion system quality control protein TatD with DNase activity
VDTLTYVDTHCHLDLIFQKMNSDNDKKAKKGHATKEPAIVDFESWREDVASSEDPDAEDYLGAQLEACLTVACSRKAMDAVREILPKPGVFAAFGCHPLSAHEWNDEMASLVQKHGERFDKLSRRRGRVRPRLPLRHEGYRGGRVFGGRRREGCEVG